jgi:hypothetical protein
MRAIVRQALPGWRAQRWRPWLIRSTNLRQTAIPRGIWNVARRVHGVVQFQAEGLRGVQLPCNANQRLGELAAPANATGWFKRNMRACYPSILRPAAYWLRGRAVHCSEKSVHPGSGHQRRGISGINHFSLKPGIPFASRLWASGMASRTAEAKSERTSSTGTERRKKSAHTNSAKAVGVLSKPPALRT